MALKNTLRETKAHVFHMAYTLDGVSGVLNRPLTLCFDGGPGSASLWVRMGGIGLRSPKLMPNGTMPPPPYQIKDNQNSNSDGTPAPGDRRYATAIWGNRIFQIYD